MDQARELQETAFRYNAGDVQRKELDAKVALHKDEPWFKHVWIPEPNDIDQDKKLNYSPLPYFEQLTRPVLVIQGTMDEIIPAESISTIQKSMGSNKKDLHKFLLLEGADHSMMFRGSSDFPYWSAMHPDYFPAMLKWMEQF